MTSSSPFDDLLRAAAAQPDPQRLLFVFTEAGLPADANDVQRAGFRSGQGGTLTPMACADKWPDELIDFAALVAESRRACPPWAFVFIGALSGSRGQAPSDAQVDAALESMVRNVRDGSFGAYMALDPAGEAVRFFSA
ncbi:hypothetical protein H4CHR_03848 [Variovorax sp. PBS-H4]|uniref:ribonucleotide reductase subunit alpha n=1 Tax=Variovorax sp. PBS-H4 TaxID=434008 RepID=UPI001317EF0A|nr:ribonucleotide reductase subunit alpha [Variovorax sp. PBS-H4]VTU36176.1 hypothetical protein H4CHR_03848 [Variovorax sp. PBS-H4]